MLIYRAVRLCVQEGSRGVMAEIQALVTPTGFGNPRRMTNGIDVNRVRCLSRYLKTCKNEFVKFRHLCECCRRTSY